MVEPIKLGPSGGAGQEFSFDNIKHIESIIVHHGLVLDSLVFTYTDIYGKKITTDRFGSSIGNLDVIKFKKDEFIISISGRYGVAMNGDSPYTRDYTIQGLVFKTNMGSYGPYGWAREGIPFHFPALDRKLAGFHGYAGPHAVNAIGLYLYPVTKVNVASGDQARVAFKSHICNPEAGSTGIIKPMQTSPNAQVAKLNFSSNSFMAKEKSPSKERYCFLDVHGKDVDSKVPSGEAIKRAILKRMADKARNERLSDGEASSRPIAGGMELSDLSDQREDVLQKAMSRLRRTFDRFPKSSELAAGAASQQNLANSINCLSQTVQCWADNLRLITRACKDLEEKDALQVMLENQRLLQENKTMAGQQSHLLNQLRKTEQQKHNLAEKLANVEDQLVMEETNRLHAEEERDKAFRECNQNLRLLEDQHRQELEEAEEGIAAYLCTAHEIWRREYEAAHPDGDPSFMSMELVTEAFEAASSEEFDRGRHEDKY